MFSLRGIFPNPQKEPKKNFVKENVKQVKNLQNSRISNNVRPVTVKYEKVACKKDHVNISAAHESTNKSQKSQSSSVKVKVSDAALIRKADMSEFLRRKMVREMKPPPVHIDEYFKQSTDNVAHQKDVGCQYIDPDATHFFADGTKLRVIYPSKKLADKLLESTEKSESDKNDKHKDITGILKKYEPGNSSTIVKSRYLSNDQCTEKDSETHRSAVSLSSMNSREARVQNNPLLAPPKYQRGIVPKYIKDIQKQKTEPKHEQTEQKHEQSVEYSIVDPHCPAGHIALPESERIETLRILREKVADLVNELNKIPIRTDTLRMKTRKTQLDQEITKLEEMIKVFSRTKVYVNIGV